MTGSVAFLVVCLVEGDIMKRIQLGLAVSVLALGLSAPATAGGGGPDGLVERNGSCSGSADWELKAHPDDGRLEVEFEVDQNQNGEEWRVVLKRNGNRFFRGVKTTQGPSGSFEVERRTNNGPGTDEIKARARHLSSDQVCRGSLTI